MSIYLLDNVAASFFERSLIRDAKVDKASIINVPDESYFGRIKAQGTLCVPGGNTTLYYGLYSEKSLVSIITLVDQGLNYFGICAGSNLAVNTFTYGLTKFNEIGCHYPSGKTDPTMFTLNLLAANTKGPNYENTSENGRAVPIFYNSDIHSLFWNKGHALEIHNGAAVRTLAHFAYLPSERLEPGAVLSQRGKARIAISGFHPEISSEDLNGLNSSFWNSSNPDFELIQRSEKVRVEIFKKMADHVQIKPNAT